MAGESQAFLEGLRAERDVPLLKGASGTLLIEIGSEKHEEPERWYLTIRRGRVTASRDGAEPDTVMRARRETMDAILAGRMNAMPAMLRGLLEVEGKVNLLVAVQALFRPSPGAADQRAAGYARRPA